MDINSKQVTVATTPNIRPKCNFWRMLVPLRLYSISRSFNLFQSCSQLLIACSLMLSASCVFAADSPPQLKANTRIASAGFYRLAWQSGNIPVELQESTDRSFNQPVTIYSGLDQATLISGKPNGTWFYRIRFNHDNEADSWSSPLSVIVTHHSLGRAIVFFCLGLFVFISIVFIVSRGARNRA